MGFANVLKKLAILRYGTLSWSGDLQDRPAESRMDESNDANKDLSLQKGENKRPKD